MILIKSKKEGFRRCGLAHPAKEVLYSDDRFTAAELAILTAEPMLTWERIIIRPYVSVSDDVPVIPAQAEIQEAEETDKSGKEPVKPAKKGKR